MQLILALLVLALPFAATAAEPELENSVRALADVFSALEQNLAEPFNAEDALYQGALPAMVRTLDPHSAFLDPERFESLKQMQSSTDTGFGSVLSITPGRVVVLQTLEGSPSARSGLTPGDEFAVVNGYPLAQLNMDQLAALLSQSRRQKVELMIKRPNFPRLIPVVLTPEEVADPSVQLRFLMRDKIAYIKVASFEHSTDQELRAAIEELGGQSLEGVVLDMRKNPGGSVESAVRLAAMFLEPKQRVLWIQGRDGPQDEVRVPEGNQPYRFPIAILVDERTASAAELVTGALQDHDRAVVVGQSSFGKGLVQSVFELSQSAGLALTTAHYLSPSGRPIQKPFADCNAYELSECGDPEEQARTYTTDSGKEIPGGGGIRPDRVVGPRLYPPFQALLKSSGVLLDFAREYIGGKKIPDDFKVTPNVLDEFQLYLSERGARPPLDIWTANVEFIRYSVEQEIVTLSLGLDRGEQIESMHDPQVLAALAAVSAAAQN
ncbi:MAG: S41 family peptidase [Acidobacteria bacterium]|nr:S41 family peptidase [Acidobacteriota bacterium]MDA1234116.1 S41 family peptidase [Acidobacteriota bacterium]